MKGLEHLNGNVLTALIVVAYGTLAFAIVCRDPGKLTKVQIALTVNLSSTRPCTKVGWNASWSS